MVRKDGVWKVLTENGEHNHGPSEDLTQHPTLRRLTEEQSAKVNEMTEAGNSPAETLEELKRIWPGIKVLTRDIYNARKKYKAQKEIAEQAANASEEQQDLVDPNGSFPGPTPNGRWEWVPEGEDAQGKNKRRRRRPMNEPQPLDPALQQSHAPNLQHSISSSSNHRPSSADFQQNLTYPQSQQPPPQQQQNSMLSPTQQRSSDHLSMSQHDSAPTRLQQTPAFTSTSSSFDFAPTTDDDQQHAAQSLSNNLFPSPSHSHSHHAPFSHQRASAFTHPADTGMMQSAVGHGGGFPSNAMGFGAGGGSQIVTATPAGQAQPRVQSGQVIMSRIERMEKEQKDQRVMLAQILGAVQCMQPPTR